MIQFVLKNRFTLFAILIYFDTATYFCMIFHYFISETYYLFYILDLIIIYNFQIPVVAFACVIAVVRYVIHFNLL